MNYTDDDDMTLLDWFAGQALVGKLSAAAHPESYGYVAVEDDAQDLANFAYVVARAMLTEKQRLAVEDMK